MTDPKRASKDAHRRSSKQSTKSSHSLSSGPSKSRPKSDVPGSSARSSKHAPSNSRAHTQDRTRSEPKVDVEENPSPSTSPTRDLPRTQSETFFLRSSIDHTFAPADLQRSLERLPSTYQTASRDGDAQGRKQSASSCESAVVRVIGAAGTGKSTFINQYANSQKSDNDSDAAQSASPSSTSVTFQELTPDDVEIRDDGSIEWPVHLRDVRQRSVDGVAVLYDVMNTESLKDLQNIIRALNEASIPTVLVASKCDYPPNLRKVDPDAIAKAVKGIFGEIKAYQYSQLEPDGPRECISSLLDANQPDAVQPFIKPSPSNGSIKEFHGNMSHRPTTSIHRVTEPSPPASVSPASFKTPPPTRSKSQTHLPSQTSLPVPEIATERSPRTFLDLDDSPRPSFGTELARNNEAELTDHADDGIPEDVASPTESGVTFDELANHLLYPPASKPESTFESTFLCFYRFFSPPLRLLDAVIQHFDAHDGNIISPWVHEPILDRDLNILDKWINTYPGDFAKLATRQKLRKFLSRVVLEHGIGEEDLVAGPSDSGALVEKYGDAARLASSASQIILALDSTAEDDDTAWACADGGPLRRSRSNTFLSMSSQDSQAQSDRTNLAEPLSRITTSNPTYDAQLIFGGQSTRTLNAMGRSRRNLDSGTSAQTLLSVAESAQRQATLLTPNPAQNLGKAQWRAFIAHSEDSIARELTRIDWVMFSSIRPRDLVRHATVPVSERTRFPALENVSRMIDHFNHIADWVTNVVLYRDKPKHRALALEKFMRVARRLRELNNYNALGAIVAGIQGTAVHRLKATKDLVSPQIQKDFMKLEILMAAARGHSSYRLAWENTSTPRVPFLPLHRRDLFVAAGAGKTFLSGDKKGSSPTDAVASNSSSGQHSQENLDIAAKRRNESSPTKPITTQPPASKFAPQADPSALVNWKKFSIMGDILHDLMQAQLTPYVGFSANEEIRSLLLDYIIIKDEDELYERSTALEPAASGAPVAGSTSNAPFGDAAARRKFKNRINLLVG